MLVSCSIGGSAPRVRGSGVEGVGVIAVGCPDTDIEVEGTASGGVRGGNIKPGLDGLTPAVGYVPLRHMLLSGDTLVGAGTPSGSGPVSEIVVAGINQALAFALAGMSASAVQGRVAQATVGLAVLTSAVGRADREQEPILEDSAKVGIRHWLASGVLRRRLQESASAGAPIALEIACVVLGEESQHIFPLLLGGLFGESALHFLDLVFHRAEPVHRNAVTGPAFNSHGAGLLQLAGNSWTLAGEGGPGVDPKSRSHFFEAKEPTADEGEGASVLDSAKSKATVLGAQAGDVSLLRAKRDGVRSRGGQDSTQRSGEDPLKLVKPGPTLQVSSEEVVDARLGKGLEDEEGRPGGKAVGKELVDSVAKSAGFGKDKARVSGAVDWGKGLLPVKPSDLRAKDLQGSSPAKGQSSGQGHSRVPNPGFAFAVVEGQAHLVHSSFDKVVDGGGQVAN